MISVPPKRSSQAGVSLVELLVVIMVIAVVASLALMSRGSANEQFQRQNASRELKVAFERARFDSVKRRAVGGSAAPKAVVIVEPTQFTLRTFATNSSSASDQVVSLPAGIQIARVDGTTLTTFDVAFDMRGETPQSPPPQFLVCNGACPATLTSSTGSTVDIVLVTPTGTVTLLPGIAGNIPNYLSPTHSSVSTSSGINPDLQIPTPTP